MSASIGTNSQNTHRGPNSAGRKRRDKILDSAAKLLLDKPFTDIAYAEIAELAGLPVSSCYHYYGDRYEVFRALDQHYSEAFLKAIDFDGPSFRHMESWQQGVDIYLRNGKGFSEQHPVAGHIWFKGKVPASTSNAPARDLSLAKRFEQTLNRYFVLPEFPNRSEVFYFAWEISEQIVASTWTTEIDRDLVFREAGKAMKLYLGDYLADDLPRRN